MGKKGPTRTGTSSFVLFMANVDVYHAYADQENRFFGHIIEYKAYSCKIDAILSGFQSEKWKKRSDRDRQVPFCPVYG